MLRADQNGDGSVDLEEFLDLVHSMRTGNPHEGPISPQVGGRGLRRSAGVNLKAVATSQFFPGTVGRACSFCDIYLDPLRQRRSFVRVGLCFFFRRVCRFIFRGKCPLNSYTPLRTVPPSSPRPLIKIYSFKRVLAGSTAIAGPIAESSS